MSLPTDLPTTVEGVRLLAEKLAREHVAAGRKVVGYVTPCAPAELIAAAGMRPMMLSAGTEVSTTLGDRVMEDLFDTSVRGIFERLLKGEFDYLSAIVLPRANDSAHRLYYYLCELQRTGEAKLPPVLLADVVMAPDEASRQYSIDALGRLWNELGAMPGWRVGDDDLRSAMNDSNATNAWLSEMGRLRRGGGIPGAKALAAFAAARMLPRDIARQVIRSFEETAAGGEKKPRVIVCGSAHHDAGLHGLIEAAGGMVVGDYHAAGDLSRGRPFDVVNPYEGQKVPSPLIAMADYYRVHPGASRQFEDAAAAIRYFATLVTKADAAIFSYFPEEEALTWDYPAQKDELERSGVRVLRLPEQTRPFDVDAHRAVVEAFVRGGGA